MATSPNLWSVGRTIGSLGLSALVLSWAGLPAWADEPAPAQDEKQTAPAAKPAVPDVIQFMLPEDHAEKAPAPGGWLGIRLGEVPPPLRLHLRLPRDQAFMIENVAKGSPAEGRLQRYDIVLGVEGQPAACDLNKFQELMGRKQPGDTLSLNVLRAGDRSTLAIKLAKRPENAAALPMVYKNEEEREGTFVLQLGPTRPGESAYPGQPRQPPANYKVEGVVQARPGAPLNPSPARPTDEQSRDMRNLLNQLTAKIEQVEHRRQEAREAKNDREVREPTEVMAQLQAHVQALHAQMEQQQMARPPQPPAEPNKAPEGRGWQVWRAEPAPPPAGGGFRAGEARKGPQDRESAEVTARIRELLAGLTAQIAQLERPRHEVAEPREPGERARPRPETPGRNWFQFRTGPAESGNVMYWTRPIGRGSMTRPVPGTPGMSPWGVPSASHPAFSVAENGAITVEVTTADGSIKAVYSSEADLQKRAPGLYRKYQRLAAELK